MRLARASQCATPCQVRWQPPALQHAESHTGRPAMQEHAAGGVTPRAQPVIFSLADLTSALGLTTHLAACQGCIPWQAVRDSVISISHGAALELRDRTTLKALAELILAAEPAQAAMQGALGLPGCPLLGNTLNSFRYRLLRCLSPCMHGHHPAACGGDDMRQLLAQHRT